MSSQYGRGGGTAARPTSTMNAAASCAPPRAAVSAARRAAGAGGRGGAGCVGRGGRRGVGGALSVELDGVRGEHEAEPEARGGRQPRGLREHNVAPNDRRRPHPVPLDRRGHAQAPCAASCAQLGGDSRRAEALDLPLPPGRLHQVRQVVVVARIPFRANRG